MREIEWEKREIERNRVKEKRERYGERGSYRPN